MTQYHYLVILPFFLFQQLYTHSYLSAENILPVKYPVNNASELKTPGVGGGDNEVSVNKGRRSEIVLGDVNGVEYGMYGC